MIILENWLINEQNNVSSVNLYWMSTMSVFALTHLPEARDK